MSSHPSTKSVALLLFGLTSMIVLAAHPAYALIPVSACGQTLDRSGEYVLTADLNCSGTFVDGTDITASDVTFHLAGHTISSTDCDETKAISGIYAPLGLWGVNIDGGTIQGFRDGIFLAASHSRVSGMTVTSACVFGMVVENDDNRVDTSVVTLSGLDGIGLQVATGSVITGNYISGNARLGVSLSNHSNNNIVSKNIVNNNGIIDREQGGIAIFFGINNVVSDNRLNNNWNGIEMESDGNLVRGNSVAGSVSVGIFITTLGTPSTVRHNIVLGSGIADLSDDSRSCGSNTWSSNVFETNLAGGVSDGGSGAGCIN
jgi:parallel beta-helix repeat protein